MTNFPDLDARIGGWVLADFDVRLVQSETYGGGLDPDASVWRARDDHGRQWAVKWTRRNNEYGLRLALSLSRAGVLGIPGPLVSRDGSPWSGREGGRLSVTEWIPGTDAYDEGLDPAQWRALGILLRRIHDHDRGELEPLQAAQARQGIRRAGIHVKRRLAEIDGLVRDTTPSLLAEPAVGVFAEEWPAVKPRLSALADAARALRKNRVATARVSCHGDPHLGNVILDVDGRPWLIDFDDAVSAPREVDLMLIELGLLFSRPITAEDRGAFWSGYGATAVDDDRILRFGCVRALEDLVETAHELLAEGTTTSRSDLLALFQGILSPIGLAGLVEERLHARGQAWSTGHQ